MNTATADTDDTIRGQAWGHVGADREYKNKNTTKVRLSFYDKKKHHK